MNDNKEKCCQLACPDEVTALVNWPGQGAKPMCERHVVVARNILAAMGYPISLEPIVSAPHQRGEG